MASARPTNLSSAQMKTLDMVNQGTSKFAITLYKALAKNQGGNVFVSPLSVQIVLALAYTGAKGDTANEIAKVLSLPEKMDDTCTGYNCLIKNLENPVLNMVNRMFVDKTVSVKSDFQKNAQKYFLAPPETMDFLKNPEGSRKQINTWVENQTNKKIVDVLAPDSLSPETRLVLINAIHFKDNWVHKFLEAKTKEKPFHITKLKSVPVQMMHVVEEFGFLYDKELKAKIVNLVYESRAFHMVVVLPDEMEGLTVLEAKLEGIDISGKIRQMQGTKVTVQLPKFKMEETMELNGILKALGLQSMFNVQTANFSGLCDKKDVVVSRVAQKVILEVNEKGTEAVAATAMLQVESIPSEPQIFIADHPFLFFILHQLTPIFIGRFNKPI